MRRLLFICLFFSASCDSGEKKVSMFAAVGAARPLMEISEQYQNATGMAVETSYGASGALANQIAMGGNADIFVSADKQWIDFLSDSRLLADSTVTAIGASGLIMISTASYAENICFCKEFDPAFFSGKKMAIGDPGHVPAGRYARQVLARLGWYDQLQPNLMLAKDVAAVQRYVALQEADFGIVYSSSASGFQDFNTQIIIPDTLHDPLIFYAALSAGASSASRDLFRMITGAEGKNKFQDHGFTTAPL